MIIIPHIVNDCKDLGIGRGFYTEIQNDCEDEDCDGCDECLEECVNCYQCENMDEPDD